MSKVRQGVQAVLRYNSTLALANQLRKMRVSTIPNRRKRKPSYSSKHKADKH